MLCRVAAVVTVSGVSLSHGLGGSLLNALDASLRRRLSLVISWGLGGTLGCVEKCLDYPLEHIIVYQQTMGI